MNRYQFLIALCVVATSTCVSQAAEDLNHFRAGMARVKITPQQPFWLLSYDWHKKAEGVEADLFARALAIEDARGKKVVLVCADILGFPPSLSRSIRKDARRRYGLRDGELLLAASHTHNGPVLPERLSLEIYHNFSKEEAKPVYAYAAELRTWVVELIGKALAEMKPARLAFGRSKATFGINRRNPISPDGPTDPDVPVLAVKSPDGEHRAVVFCYACHPVCVMADTFFKYYPDYPGVAATELERRLPGTMAFYVAGCGGDINPDPMGKLELAQLHGRALAKVVLAVLEGEKTLRPVSGPLRTHYRSIDLPLEKPPSRELLTRILNHKRPERQRYAREMLRQLDAGKQPTVVPFPILNWQFGSDLSLIALTGEVCVDYALRLKRELGAERTWVAGYANEVPCYIPSERVLNESGYEAGWGRQFGRAAATPSMSVYGWPTPFAAGVEERIVSAVHKTVRGSKDKITD